MAKSYQEFISSLNELSAFKNVQNRRDELISEMSRLEDEGLNCFSCKGYCCTYEYNSMQVTPLEAVELFKYLVEQGRVNEEQIDQVISKYRLDKLLMAGSQNLRRYYTCPFFKEGAKGCTISRRSKPLGCLGFNALVPNVSERGKCESNQEVLKKVDHKFTKDSDLCNEYIKKTLNIYWSKESIPVAITELKRLFY